MQEHASAVLGNAGTGCLNINSWPKRDLLQDPGLAILVYIQAQENDASSVTP